jgi:hypothetical protein
MLLVKLGIMPILLFIGLGLAFLDVSINRIVVAETSAIHIIPPSPAEFC